MSVSANVVELDARGLEPPQPLIRILEALEALPPDAELVARTDRRPLHLIAMLNDRGFGGQTNEAEEPESGYVTVIRHLDS